MSKFKVGDMVRSLNTIPNDEDADVWNEVWVGQIAKVFDNGYINVTFGKQNSWEGSSHEFEYPEGRFELDQAYKNEQKLKKVLGL